MYRQERTGKKGQARRDLLGMDKQEGARKKAGQARAGNHVGKGKREHARRDRQERAGM